MAYACSICPIKRSNYCSACKAFKQNILNKTLFRTPPPTPSVYKYIISMWRRWHFDSCIRRLHYTIPLSYHCTLQLYYYEVRAECFLSNYSFDISKYVFRFYTFLLFYISWSKWLASARFGPFCKKNNFRFLYTNRKN